MIAPQHRHSTTDDSSYRELGDLIAHNNANARRRTDEQAATPDMERNEGRKAGALRRAAGQTKPHPDNLKLVPVVNLGLWETLRLSDPTSPLFISRNDPRTQAPTRLYIARVL